MQSQFFSKLTDNAYIDTYTNFEPLNQYSSALFKFYKAQKGDKLYFLKSLKNPQIAENNLIQFLRKEYDISRELSHPNICKTIDFIKTKETGYTIVMEFISGCNLREFAKTKLTAQFNIYDIIGQILETFNYIHKCGIIHRDIKPENILITTNSDEIKIIDFGLSSSDGFIPQQYYGGTVGYSAPELIAGDRVDVRADIYSIGIIIEELLEHYADIGGRRNRKFKLYKQIAQRCSSLEIEKRFSSINEIKQSLSSSIKNRKTIEVSLTILIIIVVCCLFYSKKDKPITNEINTDIATIHFKCYCIIDSLILSETSKGQLTTTDSGKIYRKIEKIVKKEYGRNVDSPEYLQNMNWAAEELSRNIKH